MITILPSKFLLLTMAIAIGSCSPPIKKVVNMTYKGLPIVDLCDLPKYQAQKVYLKSTYSGIEEYWSLGPLTSKDCPKDPQVDLDFIDNYEMPSRFEKLMTEVHNSYWNSYLEIDAIGVYETGGKGGYGHLGVNKSRFLVSEIIEIKLVRNRE